MCQYSAQDGRASDWHRIHLGTLSQSGAGLLILEAAAVVPEGRISYADLGLYDDATEQALAEVLQSVRRWSPMPIGIQLAHAGRKASTDLPWKGGEAIAPDHAHGWQTVSASALPFRQGQPAPQALDEAGIDAVVDAFVASAKRAERQGLELIELHAAHGYLMHQFLSPLSNQRSDAYGGSLENRMRLTLRIFDAVRAAVSEKSPLACASRPPIGSKAVGMCSRASPCRRRWMHAARITSTSPAAGSIHASRFRCRRAIRFRSRRRFARR